LEAWRLGGLKAWRLGGLKATGYGATRGVELRRVVVTPIGSR